ncbi:MAG: imidazoleglycerol-phosphate dehydratase HisB [Mariprofundaceae bacterium]|nr:imidazoleglycerol-phosphate dehydratase HisB [Mariprofundaceae bacterium]
MRQASIERNTAETKISLSINLDGDGNSSIQSGVPFLDHMMEQIARHGLIDIQLVAKGDHEIDDHHTVEDIAICLGEVFYKAIGDKRGIVRYGHAYVPLDEALSRVVLDFSGRPSLEYHVNFPRERVGDFDIDLFREFFAALANHARISLHIDCLRGRNNHHIAETIFKALGRALRMAVAYDDRQKGIPSTKGCL